MSNIRAVRKRQQLNNLVAMVTELAKPGCTVVDFCSGTVRELIHQSSYACIFITAPDLGVHRTAAPLAATWKELVSHIFLSSFKCTLFLAGGHRRTGNYAHENAHRKWKRYTANRSILWLERATLIITLLMSSLMCAVFLLCTSFIRSFFFLFRAVSQGHVGIVLAHMLPDCQVSICVLMCEFNFEDWKRNRQTKRSNYSLKIIFFYWWIVFALHFVLMFTTVILLYLLSNNRDPVIPCSCHVFIVRSEHYYFPL